MAVFFAVALLLGGTLLLLKGADWFLDGLSALARRFGMSALVLGILLAGLEPEEMLTAALASARGAPALALGNVLGTNITISTVALGLSALIFPILIAPSVRRQALLATLVSVLPVVLLFFGTITRLEGVLLLAVFVAYTWFLFRTDREAMKRLLEADDDDDDDDLPTSQTSWKPFALTLGGLLAMAFGGPLIVEGALRLTTTLGVREGAVGATIVSLGTGAEMIALGISAARKKQAEILVGGILGSFAYNLLVTLGLAAVVRPLSVDPSLLRTALPFLLAVHLLLLALIYYGKISRLMGLVLIAIYLAYLLSIIFI